MEPTTSPPIAASPSPPLRARLLDVAATLSEPSLARTVEGKEVDFFWPDQRLILETDGRQTHFTLAAAVLATCASG